MYIIVHFLSYKYVFFSYEAFSTCPYDSKPSELPKDTINNVANLEDKIQSVSGDMNGQGRFTLKNEDYFEGTYNEHIKIKNEIKIFKVTMYSKKSSLF